MKYDWKNKDLRKVTVFDLTDDIEIIRGCTNCPSYTLDSREEHAAYLNKCDEYFRVLEFCMLYQEDCNKEFLEELKKTFPTTFQENPALPNVFWE